MCRIPPELEAKLILSVGTHQSHRPLSPVEVARAIDEAIRAGATPQELAQKLHLENTTMVGRFRKLLNLAAGIQHLIGWGSGQSTISFSTASVIGRLSNPAEQEELARAVLEHRLSSKEVIQVVQVMQRARKSVADAVGTVLQLRPQVVRYHVIVGAILSERLQAALGRMTQGQRDDLLRTVLERRCSGLASWGGRLGVDRFSLVGGPEFAAAVLALPGGFERAINSFLDAEVFQGEGGTN